MSAFVRRDAARRTVVREREVTWSVAGAVALAFVHGVRPGGRLLRERGVSRGC